MINDSEHALVDPIQTKINQARQILRDLQFDRERSNERSALTLLALLHLLPDRPWADATNPLIGVTPIMDWVRVAYGRSYAPNSRETFRRFTLHQFVQAGLVSYNPDQERPVNSPKAVYQITADALALLRLYESDAWAEILRNYLANMPLLLDSYATERAKRRLPIRLPSGDIFTLSAGGQNILVKDVIEQFCPRFTPAAQIIYIGDAGDKDALYDRASLAALRVVIDEHGKMPDVIVYDGLRNWLVLIEAVTSHGPVDSFRRVELRQLFSGSTAGLVYVTAFLSRRSMNKYLAALSWGTEVWIAESPDHLIHFDGERFLGPYDVIPLKDALNQ